MSYDEERTSVVCKEGLEHRWATESIARLNAPV